MRRRGAWLLVVGALMALGIHSGHVWAIYHVVRAVFAWGHH